jgi:hypothetical protein
MLHLALFYQTIDLWLSFCITIHDVTVRSSYIWHVFVSDINLFLYLEILYLTVMIFFLVTLLHYYG